MAVTIECGRAYQFGGFTIYPEIEGVLILPWFITITTTFPSGFRNAVVSNWLRLLLLTDALRSRLNEFGKMPDVIIGIGINKLPASRIAMHGLQSRNSVRGSARLFIKQDIPVGEAHHTVVEIVDHAAAVFFAQYPGIVTGRIKTFGATFGEERVLVGIGFMHPFQVIVHRCTAAPVFVPVKAKSPDVFGGFGSLKYVCARW